MELPSAELKTREAAVWRALMRDSKLNIDQITSLVSAVQRKYGWGHQKLYKFWCIFNCVDLNAVQLRTLTFLVSGVEPLPEEWEAFFAEPVDPTA